MLSVKKKNKRRIILVTAIKTLLWSQPELDILNLYYKGTKQSTLFIQNVIKDRLGINRSITSIQHKAGTLNLTIHTRSRWTKEQEYKLENLAGQYSVEDLSKKLKRTKYSIYNKAYTLGIILNPQARSDWYTKRDLLEIFAVDEVTLNRWIASNLIPFKMFNKQVYQFARTKVREFILKYPMELTGRNLSLIRYNDILCPKYVKT
jgi:hypothetical protein